MTPLPTISGVYRVAFNYQGPSGLTATTVQHYHAPASSELLVFTAINAHFTVAMLGAINGATNMVSTVITHLDGTSGAVTFAAPTGSSGAGSGDAIAQAACIISLGTQLRGARHRGRSFLPFVAEGEQQAGFINGSTVTSVQNAWDTYLTDMAGDGVALCVASYVHSDANDVTQLAVRNVCGTIKKRVDRQR